MTPVCLPGAIYWSAGITVFTQAMLRFYLHDEQFTMFPASPCMELADDRSNLTNMVGKLGYAHTTGHTMKLWMAEDDGVPPKWSLYFTIVLPWTVWNLIPFSAYQGVIYLCLDLTHIYRYNTENGSLEQVVKLHQEISYVQPQGTLNPLPGGWDWFYCCVQYSETLVSIRGH
ncbi:hypothetical protein QOZ80_2BG0178240 [Eleusine coracana subsp. coracana]|nr:hypothetical protein QOZ80_3BG0297750 [Eleusine coracana subsp. coracana]KAK3153611.1 hypothetical protein QOZ80_2BG0178240 [Eleusine coracana subsp. coracana]